MALIIEHIAVTRNATIEGLNREIRLIGVLDFSLDRLTLHAS